MLAWLRNILVSIMAASLPCIFSVLIACCKVVPSAQRMGQKPKPKNKDEQALTVKTHHRSTFLELQPKLQQGNYENSVINH